MRQLPNPSHYIHDANLLLRDGLLAFHDAWWTPRLGANWHDALRQQVRSLKKKNNEITKKLNPKDLSDLFLITTLFWESEFSAALEPFLQKRRMRNARTFRSRIEQAREYRNLYAHQEDFTLEEVVDVLKEYKTVLAIFSEHTESVAPFLTQLQRLFDEVERLYAQEKYALMTELGGTDPDPRPVGPSPTSLSEEGASEVVAIAENTYVEQSTPAQEVAEEVTAIPEQSVPNQGSTEELVTEPTAQPEEPEAKKPEAFDSERGKVPAPKEVPIESSWWSRYFGKKEEVGLPKITLRNKADIKEDILDALVTFFSSYDDPQALPFEQVQILVWAPQLKEDYEHYFSLANLNIPSHLASLGLVRFITFPINVEVVTEWPVQLQPSELRLAEKQGFFLVSKNMAMATNPVQIATHIQKAKLIVVGGELESRVRTFWLEANANNKLTVGRGAKVVEGYMNRINQVAFKDIPSQKTIHKKHAYIQYRATEKAYRIFSENVNGLALFRKGQNEAYVVSMAGAKLEDGDEIQLRLHPSGLVILRFELMV